MPALLFLSHIHEERELALALKLALEDEFSGFVEVFVSSDGTSIPAGANFLKRIEDGLVNCVGALYLISPASVKRNWINFELGAVWIRNLMNLNAGLPAVPAIPVCHCGLTPGALPAPLNNLNGINANDASALEFAFRSLQAAVGGRGKLKTDFNALAATVVAFELERMLGANVVKLVELVVKNRAAFIAACEANAAGMMALDAGMIETTKITELKALEAGPLKGQIHVKTSNPGTAFASGGAFTGASVQVDLRAALVLQFKHLLAP